MKVLLGVGGSEDAFRALDWAIRRLGPTDDELTVAVLDNPGVDADLGAVADRVEATLEDADLAWPVRQLPSEPGSALVTLAETEDFDEIVLGGGLESPMGKIDVGRIAEYVVLNATVTVTLVR